MSEVDAADHVEDEVVGAMRTAAAAGAYAGVQLARARQERARRAQEEGAAAAKLNAQRVEAMWQESRSELQPVMDDAWWDRASVEDIAHAHQTASAWEGRDEVAPYAARIRDEVRDRYGVDLEEVRPEDASRTLNLREGDREHEGGQKDRAEAERLMKEADQAESAEQDAHATDDPNQEAKEHDAGHAADEHARNLYDSADRREALGEDLTHRGVPVEAVHSKVTADVGQGRSSTEAPAQSTGKAPQAKKGRNPMRRNRDRSRQR